MNIIMLIIGLALGSFIGFLLGKYVFGKPGTGAETNDEVLRDLESQIESYKNDLQQLQTANALLEQKVEAFNTLKGEKADLDKEVSELRSEIRVFETNLKNEQKNAEEKIELLKKNRELLVKELQDFMHENNEQISQQHKKRLDGLLEPLHKDIKEFQKTFIEKSGQQSQQFNSLADLNRQLSEDASNLTKALKGEVKTQGNWGELVLERILTSSGLERGREYLVQESYKNEDGRTMYPDVVVHLPENRDVIIDSKVTLVHFEQYTSAEDDEQQSIYIKQHLRAVKEHIKNLSSKKYDDIKELHSLDQVIMFMPVEGAYILTVKEDPGIIEEAQKAGIMLVCPSTLMLVLYIIHHIWRQEDQSRNALIIAEEAGKMYDKFVGFVEDMEKLGSRLKSAHDEYDQAFNKLQKGRGNLIKRAQDLKKLGVKSRKSISPEYLDDDPAEIEVENEENS